LYNSNFADEAEDTLIRYDWIIRATKPHNFPDLPRKIHGLDVAEQGVDKTILTDADTDGLHYRIDRQRWIRQTETIPTAKEAAQLISKTDEVNVDSIGVGAGVYSYLKENGYKANSIRVSEKPTVDDDRFLNQKSQRWWQLRSIFEADLISIPDDPVLISQLSQQRYKFTSAGKIQIVDAEGKSPDYADSLMLTIKAPSRYVGFIAFG